MISNLAGAFDGPDLFRTTLPDDAGIFPVALNNPARLPSHPIWASLGRGQPWGLPWAAFTTASFGAHLKNWQAAASLYSSGDELYRESSLSAAFAKQIENRFVAGINIAYQQVTIDGFNPGNGEILVGAALTSYLTKNLQVSLWYSGQAVNRKQIYKSLTRQLFHLAATSYIGRKSSWTLAIEKIPGYDFRQLVEIALFSQKEGWVHIGYRTAPGIPYLGIQLPIRRLSLSLRLYCHPVLGASTAFGFTFK